MERIARREKGNASILSLACSPKRDEDTDVIAVVDKNQTLSLYDATGRQVGMNSRRQTRVLHHPDSITVSCIPCR